MKYTYPTKESAGEGQLYADGHKVWRKERPIRARTDLSNLKEALANGSERAVKRVKKLAKAGSVRAQNTLVSSGIVKGHKRSVKGKSNTTVKRHSRKSK